MDVPAVLFVLMKMYLYLWEMIMVGAGSDRRLNHPPPPESTANRRIKLYGERNSGTNYLSRLIRLNLAVREVPGVVPGHIMKLQKAIPGMEMLRDLYFRLTYHRNLGWKHSRVRPPKKLRRHRLADSVGFLTVTKNPYSWLLSLHRRPYHQYFDEDPDLLTFLRSPWRTVGRDECGGDLRNPIELWNLKNASYLPLADLGGLNLTTESVLLAPEASIEQIRQRFGLTRLGAEFRNYERSTKEEGKDNAWYRDYYLHERWRENLPAEAIATINETVDQDLMAHFGYRVLSPDS